MQTPRAEQLRGQGAENKGSSTGTAVALEEQAASHDPRGAFQGAPRNWNWNWRGPGGGRELEGSKKEEMEKGARRRCRREADSARESAAAPKRQSQERRS